MSGTERDLWMARIERALAEIRQDLLLLQNLVAGAPAERAPRQTGPERRQG